MLTSKRRDELAVRPAADRRSRSPDHAEPRSFAPNEAAASRWSVRAPWPEAWSDLDPDAVIRVDKAVAGPAAAPDEALAQRRALIVVPCLNEAPVIGKVIAAVLGDPGLVDPLILVADGGSSDGSREVVQAIAARDPRVRLLVNPDRLQSAGVNLAVRTAGRGRPWLVRLDAHADYPEDYVSTLISEAQRTGAQSVVVAMETRGEGLFQRAVAAAQNSRLGTGGAVHRIGARSGWVEHGHHALFRCDAFQAAGGYDQTFSHNEDAELDLRLRRAGARIWLTDRTRVIYHPRRTPTALWRQYFNYGKGRARTILKHGSRLRLRQALPLAVLPAVLAALASPMAWAMGLPLALWAMVCLGYGVVLAVTEREPAVLLAGPAAMIMHLAWSAGFWRQALSSVRSGAKPRTQSAARGAVRAVT